MFNLSVDVNGPESAVRQNHRAVAGRYQDYRDHRQQDVRVHQRLIFRNTNDDGQAVNIRQTPMVLRPGNSTITVSADVLMQGGCVSNARDVNLMLLALLKNAEPLTGVA
ncbi:MAG: hypothetical protein CMK32_12405 [Porticoccaceae bacterium]|nr:hypothetical protein [Porticoccaceae bacterium]